MNNNKTNIFGKNVTSLLNHAKLKQSQTSTNERKNKHSEEQIAKEALIAVCAELMRGRESCIRFAKHDTRQIKVIADPEIVPNANEEIKYSLAMMQRPDDVLISQSYRVVCMSRPVELHE